MTSPINVEPQPVYAPTTSQLERAAALRRFNRLYIYLPTLLAGLVVVALIALLFWGVFSSQTDGTRRFASALADIVLILAMLPMLLLCMIGPLLAAGLIYINYERRRQGKASPLGRLQLLFWRLEHFLGTIYGQLRLRYLPKAAAPVIEAHARAAYVQTLLNQIRNIIKRS